MDHDGDICSDMSSNGIDISESRSNSPDGIEFEEGGTPLICPEPSLENYFEMINNHYNACGSFYAHANIYKDADNTNYEDWIQVATLSEHIIMDEDYNEQEPVEMPQLELCDVAEDD